VSRSSTNTLSYFVFGSRPEYQNELSLSVLSATRFLRIRHADIRLVLVTEEGRRRDDLPVEHVHFTAGEFARWTGGGANVHRVKEFALLKVLERYGGKVAHIDPDTFFVDHPSGVFDRISSGSSVMHENEGPLVERPLWNAPLCSGSISIGGFEFSASSPMYNSGVIGIHQCDARLLLEAVRLQDELFSRWPIFNVEQLCIGAVLARSTKLSECKDIVRHYWGPERRFINLQSSRLFQFKTKGEFDELASRDSFPAVGYPKISVLSRLRSRFGLGLAAKDPDYRFAFLAYLSATEWIAQDRDNANAWAHIAADGLRYYREKEAPKARVSSHHQLKHFAQLSPDRLRANHWLTGAAIAAWERTWQTESSEKI